MGFIIWGKTRGRGVPFIKILLTPREHSSGTPDFSVHPAVQIPVTFLGWFKLLMAQAWSAYLLARKRVDLVVLRCVSSKFPH